jgi:hypothetical protein
MITGFWDMTLLTRKLLTRVAEKPAASTLRAVKE